MFKWALPAIVVALLSASGCCCVGPCGPLGLGLACKPGCGMNCRGGCGQSCGSSCGASCGAACGASCGPSCGCDSCATCGPSLTCSQCCGGIKYWLNGRCYAGRSCGQKYWGEWVSDPPYCCDPCNQCANFVGPRCCGPGPLLRLWNAVACNPCCNSCNSCGGAGCGACGGGYSAGYGSYGGGGCSTCGGGQGNIMQENWDNQSPAPVPGQPIHNAGQPTPARMTQRMPAAPQQQMVSRPTVMRTSGQQPVYSQQQPVNTMRR